MWIDINNDNINQKEQSHHFKSIDKDNALGTFLTKQMYH